MTAPGPFAGCGKVLAIGVVVGVLGLGALFYATADLRLALRRGYTLPRIRFPKSPPPFAASPIRFVVHRSGDAKNGTRRYLVIAKEDATEAKLTAFGLFLRYDLAAYEWALIEVFTTVEAAGSGDVFFPPSVNAAQWRARNQFYVAVYRKNNPSDVEELEVFPNGFDLNAKRKTIPY